VELPRAADGPGPLGHGPAGRASLWVVQQTLACEEGLFPTRENELTSAVAAGEGPILEHPCPVLLVQPLRPGACRGPPRRLG
jgi:hypothetical protein